MPLHRSIKNVVKNYTDSEKKVREATSNDPWGPSSSLMAEIADKTHNAVALPEIMGMIWRRLNDRSKHWRHIYKALVLLDYLIKSGSEKVAIQCRENIHVIDTLKEFQHTEDGKDYGSNVRIRAQEVASLLRNRERLEEERERTLLAHKRISYCSGTGSFASPTGYLGGYGSPTQRSSSSGLHVRDRLSPNIWKPPSTRTGSRSATELESFSPQSVGEEELQLQLALVISKEEHDREESRRRDEELKVQMALEQSRRENEMAKEQKTGANTTAIAAPGTSDKEGLFNLVDTSLSAAPANLPDPWSACCVTSSAVEPAKLAVTQVPAVASTSSAPAASLIPIDDPWRSPVPVAGVVPSAFSAAANPTSTAGDVWSLQNSFGPPLFDISSNNNNVESLFAGRDAVTPKPQPNGSTANYSLTSPFTSDHNGSGGGGGGSTANGSNGEPGKAAGETERRHTPADFLGEHKGLVDLDRLIVVNPASTNPFATTPRDHGGAPSNPFLSPPASKPSLNELAPSRTLAQPALPAPFAISGLPVFQGQPFPIQNPVIGGVGGGGGVVASVPPIMPGAPMGQYTWATMSRPVLPNNPNPTAPNTSTLNPFY